MSSLAMPALVTMALPSPVHSKIFNEKVSVVLQRLSIEGMEQRVTGSVCHSGTSLRLTAFAEAQRSSTKSSLHLDPRANLSP
ncbi:hypothetical protein BpHYR1_014969 [Brachionus plicatilis]|uniref:Uncharacterized protein n=1 Tax=Brachionus plicatilis TaxID=10195 RepID=A0A3M7QT98_BRAPC|nr:hypothetical protein BpHYR1_014969 [Brachionus plicatilis]